MEYRFCSYEDAKRRVEELENLLAVKGNKALVKVITPQPIKNFYCSEGVNTMFKQLLKIHDAEMSLDTHTLVYDDEALDNSKLVNALGELIIFATTYLEQIGCNAESRQLLFYELNKKFKENE